MWTTQDVSIPRSTFTLLAKSRPGKMQCRALASSIHAPWPPCSPNIQFARPPAMLSRLSRVASAARSRVANMSMPTIYTKPRAAFLAGAMLGMPFVEGEEFPPHVRDRQET